MRNKIFLIIFLLLLGFVAALSISGNNVNYSLSEQNGTNPFLFNFSNNVSFEENETLNYFNIDISQANIYLNGNVTNINNITSWINMSNDTGILSINSKYDNQSGILELPLAVSVTKTGGGSIEYRNYTFHINATNDAPNWTNQLNSLSFPLNASDEIYYLNISDEEGNYPITFNITWDKECYHVPWSNNTNCELFNITSFDQNNNTGMINFTPTNEYVGEYNATIYIQEGGNHTCPHPPYCDEDYNKSNITVSYNLSVLVLTQLEINTTNCSETQFEEGVTTNCMIYIRTQGRTDQLNMSSNLSFANSSAGLKVPSNQTWFIPVTTVIATNNEYYYNVSLTPTKQQVGNWSINLSVKDLTSGEPISVKNFYILVNRNETLNSVPHIDSVSDKVVDAGDKLFAALDVSTNFTVNVSDNDFFIEDKWDGYNETFSLDLTFKKDGNAVSFENWNYTLKYPSYNPLALTNVTTFNIIFNPNSSDIGNYSVMAIFSDKQGANATYNFTLNVINDSAPKWKQESYFFDWVVGAFRNETTNNITNLNLNNASYYASDKDIEETIQEDVLTYSVVGVRNVDYPFNFNLSSDGILNFFPWKQDVSAGFNASGWSFIVRVCDKYDRCDDSTWIFNITNINSRPNISTSTDQFLVSNSSAEGGTHNYFVNQSKMVNISLRVYDDDLLIKPAGEYEKINITVEINNLTAPTIPLNFSFSNGTTTDNYTDFYADFYADYDYLGNYTIVINASDSNEYDSFTFNLTLIHVNENPILDNISNISVQVINESFVYDFNATDREDNESDGDLTYIIIPLSAGTYPEINESLYFNSTTGVLNFNFSKGINNYPGIWKYEILVNDSENGSNSTEFYLYVYGYPEIIYPLTTQQFIGTEGQTVETNFTVKYPLNKTNLTFEIYANNVYVNRQNNDTCNDSFCYFLYDYTLRYNNTIFINETEQNVTVNNTYSYMDEGFGEANETHLQLFVYNKDYPDMVSNFNWTKNITHVNENISFKKYIQDMVNNTFTDITLNLRDYFSDYDYFDEYYLQYVNFTIDNGEYNVNNIDIARSDYVFDGWNVTFNFENAGVYNITIIGKEWDNFGSTIPSGMSNDSSFLNEAQSNYFLITIIDPTIVPEPTKGGSGGTSKSELAQHYGLKILTPEDILISDQNYVELNFSVMNTGNVDLYEINLSGIVELNSIYSGDISLTLSEDWINELKVGEMRNYTLWASVNTNAVGKYLITIFGNVTKPKFSDWGEFYIEVLAMDESELANLLVFTEKLVSENPECLELTEYLNEAKKLFDADNLADSQVLTTKIVESCMDAISSNEQNRYNVESPVLSTRIAIYSLASVLVFSIILVLIIVNRRVKFKKYNNDEYV